jgi:ABC-type lipoprotein release transport system permease subunit
MLRQLPFEYAFRNLGRSPARLAASLFGAALVVLLVLASAGFVRGMQLTLTSHAGLYDNVILLGAGSEEAIERSQIDAGIGTIAAASIAGIRTEGGVPFVSPEIHIALPLRESATSAAELPAVLRGVTATAFLVHPEVEIVEGRAPKSGAQELMVGGLAATRMGTSDERLAVGQSLYFDNRAWTIVGRFSAPNTVMDAEVWTPLSDLQIATKREASLSCVVVSMDRGTFADADLFAKSRLDLELAAIRESDYYAALNKFYRPIRLMVIGTAALIALGGVFGGLNTMYAAFAARVREVGMLQSLGFTRLAIVLNLSEESLFAAACGTILGLGIGLLLLDGVAVRFSMGAFALTLDAPVVLTGIAGGLLVGLVGAIPPAIRCLRLPITEALKSF